MPIGLGDGFVRIRAPRRVSCGSASPPVVNVLLIGLAASSGGIVDHAVEASLLVFCISIGARHDGFVRAAFASDAGSGRTGSIS